MELGQEQTKPAARKGRRGLARKKDPADVDQHPGPTLSRHDSSVYSSCVSRSGFKSLYGLSGPGDDRKESDQGYATMAAGTHTELNMEGSPENVDNEILICDAERKELRSSEEDLFVIDHDDEVHNFPAGVESIRSPTPPPVFQAPTHGKKRMKRQLQSALKTLKKAKTGLDMSLEPPTPLTAGKRRGPKKYQVSNAELVQEESPVKTDMLVKIRYLSSMHRLWLKLKDPFHNLLRPLSQEIGQEEQLLQFFLHDKALSLSKSPLDVGLTVADIIECHCIKEKKVGDRVNETICVFIQRADKKQRSEINIAKRQPFQEVLDNYAETAGIDASSFRFCFDGDSVGPADTPLSLDMDDGDILDLVPATTQPTTRSFLNEMITIM